MYGWQRFRVNLFIPRPTRCFKCQRFGHIQENCRAKIRCSTCGGSHGYEGCEQTIKCVNCGGNHSAASKTCPKFLEIQGILKVKTEGKMSYAEALKSFETKKAAQQSASISRLIQNSGIVSSETVTNTLSSQNTQIPIQSRNS